MLLHFIKIVAEAVEPSAKQFRAAIAAESATVSRKAFRGYFRKAVSLKIKFPGPVPATISVADRENRYDLSRAISNFRKCPLIYILHFLM